MPLRLNIGLNKKVGEPNYSSRGASVNLEVEVDSSLVTEPARFQEKVRQLELLNSFSSLLNSTLDTGLVREKALEGTCQLLGGETASLLLVDSATGEQTLVNDITPHTYNAYYPGLDGNYFAKDTNAGIGEIAPDGTELYFADRMCASNVPGGTCGTTRDHRGQSIITTPY